MTTDVDVAADPPEASPRRPRRRPRRSRPPRSGPVPARPRRHARPRDALHARLPRRGRRGARARSSRSRSSSRSPGFLITGVLLRNHLTPGGEHDVLLDPAAPPADAGGDPRADRDRRLRRHGRRPASRPTRCRATCSRPPTWTANWHFILSGQSYMNLFAAPSPVQHFWSLAIEEQFYLVLPIVLIFLRRGGPGRRRSCSPSSARAALLSTAWMAALYQGGASLDRLYYGTDTRMAELLVGARARRRPLPDRRPSSRSGSAGSSAAVGLVVLRRPPLWCWSNIPLADGPIWRGGFLAVLVPVVRRDPRRARRQGAAPARSCRCGRSSDIGRISYGVYLFHWPVYLWLDQSRTGLDGWALLGAAPRGDVHPGDPVVPPRRAADHARAARSGSAVGRGSCSSRAARARRGAVLRHRQPLGAPIPSPRCAPTPPCPATAGDGVLNVLVIPPAAGRRGRPATCGTASTTTRR